MLFIYVYVFTDEDPGSIIPKHYRRVEIRYSKLGSLYLKFFASKVLSFCDAVLNLTTVETCE